ncbi:MAG: cold shock domain-containing protein [Candidatus Latescibacterota bacterium]|jgi:CspA family cold shock protein
MAKGVIKFYSDRRGYGFIRSEDNRSPSAEVYVHYSQLRGFRSPREGQIVTFDLKEGERGPEAVNVNLVS